MLRFSRFLAPALALALLAGCDAGTTDVDTSDATADTDAAALSIASAIALDGGGALDEMAVAALATSPPDGGAPGPGHPGRPGDGRPGCPAERSYDDAAMLWTVVADCERSSPNGAFAASFSRTSTFQFSAGGQPQRDPQTADALDYRILSGTSLLRSPMGSHRLTSLTAAFDVTDLDADLVTVNGTYARAGADTLRARGRGVRTAVYTLDLEATDIRGPRRVYERWRAAVSGTLSGHYVATMTVTPTGGATQTRTVDRTFTVTFPTGGEAEIALGGRRYRADRSTGEIASLR